MKKLLALLLTAALMLSLGVGALAYEDLTPPLWQRWGYDSLEEYLADWDETEEEYAQEVAEELAYRAEQDAFIATYDPETHDFTPALWEYYGYGSKAEMLEDWEMDEAGYAAQVDSELFDYESRDWTYEDWDAWYEANAAEMLLEEKAALGLVYEINIMADGEALSFLPDAAPVIRNSCTMAPLGVIVQALHAEATWDNDTGAVTITRGDQTLELAVDGGTLKASDGSVLDLPSLPYVEGEEVYIPVRAVAEALGYEVQWSETYRTAVLVDIEAAAAAFDADYTVLNAILAMNSELDKTQSYKGEGRLDLAVTLPALGSAAGYTGSIRVVTVQNGQAVNGTVQYDVGQLLGLIVLMSGEGELPDAGELDALAEAMAEGMELICDLDSMKLYLRGRLLALAAGLEDADADVWYGMDLGELAGGMDAAALRALSDGTVSVAQLICTMATGSGADAIYLQEILDEMAETFEPFSDSHFTGDGAVRSLVYTPEDYDGMVIELNVTMDGERAARIAGSVGYDADGTRFTCTFDQQPMTSTVSGSIFAEGSVEIAFMLTANTVAAPGTAVVTAPPEGTTVVDLFEALYGDFPTDANGDS